MADQKGEKELRRLRKMSAWMQGESSPAWWGGVVRLQRNRVGADLKDFIGEGRGPGPAYDQLRADIYLLFVAIRHVYRYAERLTELSDDPRLRSATDEFVRLAPQAKNVRDFLEHLDEYSVGEGQMHKRGQMDRDKRELQFLMPRQVQWDDEIVVEVGNSLAPVKTAAQAAMKLAEALSEFQSDEIAKNPSAAISDRP